MEEYPTPKNNPAPAWVNDLCKSVPILFGIYLAMAATLSFIGFAIGDLVMGLKFLVPFFGLGAILFVLQAILGGWKENWCLKRDGGVSIPLGRKAGPSIKQK
ncbi:MAG: hypothetical protein A2849_01945 [Candidatus Taylorbacteria bacterium RIFCSPHIGHO2_01_FULL_51_15]|uniref:Uncharacterized protein n=1 Tax=Candidatus Taylorbacteria bacterium RIFCSPHIGHO2_01_FULL_51_15 TaxID=1802304 RepID=A0A1G2MAK1_9BACT|nr:MAG: hypothetical protein A2849_01945 [Candidatus Taylorbacteria bacterium RIFCSPHIGHO2_01_FULL_51_15]